jgi:predicted nucleic acid-binding protein
MYLLDTDIVEEMRRFGGDSSDPVLETWVGSIPANQLFIATVTLLNFNLAVNDLKLVALQLTKTDPKLAKTKRKEAEILRTWILETLLVDFENRILLIDDQVSHRMVSLSGSSSNKGPETVIAATALVHRLPIVTRNPERYAFAGVSIVNPWESVEKAPKADHFEFMQQESTGIGI